MEKIKIENNGGFWFWMAGWLFTIGYLHLAFWQGALAIILWPYDIGTHLASLYYF